MRTAAHTVSRTDPPESDMSGGYQFSVNSAMGIGAPNVTASAMSADIESMVVEEGPSTVMDSTATVGTSMAGRSR